jgi:hypothetical protein
MSECPDIDEFVGHDSDAMRHAATCSSCAAVSSLREVRDARTAARGDECVEAEIAIALQSEGLLDDDGAAGLAAHVALCPECNEVAVRVAATRGRPSIEDFGKSKRQPRRWGLVLGFVAASVASAAAGALWMRGRAVPDDRAVAEAPRATPVPAVPGAGLEPVAPAPCPTPTPTDERRVAPPAPRPPSSKGLVDPWASRSPPAPATGTGYLTIVCTPGCDSVSVGGKNLGASPVVRAPLPSGSVNVELRHGDVRSRVSVKIVAGQVSARRVSMPTKDGVLNPWQ